MNLSDVSIRPDENPVAPMAGPFAIIVDVITDTEDMLALGKTICSQTTFRVPINRITLRDGSSDELRAFAEILDIARDSGFDAEVRCWQPPSEDVGFNIIVCGTIPHVRIYGDHRDDNEHEGRKCFGRAEAEFANKLTAVASIIRVIGEKHLGLQRFAQGLTLEAAE